MYINIRDKPDIEHLIHIEETTSHKQISALRIGSWNFRGLASKRNYKLKDQTFVDYLQEYDIIILTETWTNTKCDLSLPDYNYFLFIAQDRHVQNVILEESLFIIKTFFQICYRYINSRMTMYYGLN